MTITIANLFEGSAAIDALVAEKGKLPWAASYRIARLNQRLRPELATANETRLDIFRKYGEEKDGAIRVTDDKTSALNAELMPFMMSTIDLDIKPLDPAIFEGVQIEQGITNALLPFLADDAPGADKK